MRLLFNVRSIWLCVFLVLVTSCGQAATPTNGSQSAVEHSLAATEQDVAPASYGDSKQTGLGALTDSEDSLQETTSLVPPPSTVEHSTVERSAVATLAAPQPGDSGLSDTEAERIAQNFLAELGRSAANANFEPMAELWTGYPYGPSERPKRLERFADTNPWLLDSDVELSVVPAWSFTPEHAMVIVAISDRAGRGTTSLLLDRMGNIQRLEDAASGTPPTQTGSSLVFDGIPTEGHAAAYLGGLALPDHAITVDHNVFTTTLDLSTILTDPARDDDLSEYETLIFSAATPEFPTTRTMRLSVSDLG